VAVFIGVKFVEAGGKQFTRYTYDIQNKSDYPAELFASSASSAAMWTKQGRSSYLGRSL
jgi:hypothetical protein